MSYHDDSLTAAAREARLSDGKVVIQRVVGHLIDFSAYLTKCGLEHSAWEVNQAFKDLLELSVRTGIKSTPDVYGN